MYFSLIMPHPDRELAAAHARLSGPYAEHQWLWRFFPAEAGSPRDFLFHRREVAGRPRYYGVSVRAPHSDDPSWLVQTQSYAPRVAAGMRLGFELRANPVVSRRVDGKHGRHDVVMDAKRRMLAERGLSRWVEWKPDRIAADGQPDPRPQLYELVQINCSAWLEARAEAGGFAIDPACLVADAYQQQAGKQGQLHFSTVDFRGELTVIDPDRFSATLRQGIGPAKAFGCGLLLVRPLP